MLLVPGEPYPLETISPAPAPALPVDNLSGMHVVYVKLYLFC